MSKHISKTLEHSHNNICRPHTIPPIEPGARYTNLPTLLGCHNWTYNILIFIFEKYNNLVLISKGVTSLPQLLKSLGEKMHLLFVLHM